MEERRGSADGQPPLKKHKSVPADLPAVLLHTLKGHMGSVTNVHFNRNGRYCLSCGQDKTIRLWNPVKGTPIKTYHGHGYEVLDLDVNEDNSQIVSSGSDRQVFQWDVATGAVIRKFAGHESRVNCVSFNKDCSVVVSGSYDKTVRIWDCKSRSFTPIQILEEAKDSVADVYIADEEIFTASVDGLIRNYDIRAGRLRTDFIGQPTTSVNLSNDKNCILASSLDNHVRLLDKDSGELLGDYTGHINKQYKISSALTNTDAYVVSGSEDNRVCFWDIVEGHLVHELKGHTKVVCGVAVHPEPGMPVVVSCSQDGTLKVWAKGDTNVE